MSARVLWALLALLLGATPLAAQEDAAEVLELDVLAIEAEALEAEPEQLEADEEEEPVVEVRLIDRLAEGASVTVLEGPQLEAALSVADALDRVAGMDVRRQGGSGQIAVAQLRGSYGEQALVLLDGAPLAPGRAADLGALSLGHVERVEVLRGPEAARYGLGALGGVVNIVTRRSAAEPYAALTTRAGGHGHYELDLSGGTPTGSWNVSHLQATNDYSFARGGGATATRHNNEVSRQQVSGSWDSGGLHWRAGLSRLRRGVPGSAEFPTLHAQLDRDSAWLQADGERWRADASVTRSRFRDPQPYLGAPIESADTRARLEASYGALALKDDAWGWRPRVDWIDSRQFGAHQRVGLDGAWFVRWERGALTHHLELGAAASSDVGVDPLARYAVTRRLDACSRLHAAVGYAVRHPDFAELYLTNSGSVQGNPDLAPERLLAGEVGYRRDGRVSLAATAFWNAYDDSIIFAPVSAYLVRAINTGAATVAGVEAELDVSLAHGASWRTAATWLPLAELDSGVPLPGRAERRIYSALELERDGWRGALAADFTGAMTADLFGNLRIAPRTLVDARLSRKLGDGGLELAVTNLFDAAARDSWHYPLPGREVFVTWRTNL